MSDGNYLSKRSEITNELRSRLLLGKMVDDILIIDLGDDSNDESIEDPNEVSKFLVPGSLVIHIDKTDDPEFLVMRIEWIDPATEEVLIDIVKLIAVVGYPVRIDSQDIYWPASIS